MAALPYIQLYAADYLADTVHLSTDEHGAYFLLILNYWQTGKPIPKNRLQSITKLSNERWTDVEQSLKEYFNDDGKCWQHDRLDADLIGVGNSQKQRSNAGKASAEARKRAAQDLEKQKKKNDRSTTVQRPLNDRSTNKEQNRSRTDPEQIKDIVVVNGVPEKHQNYFDHLVSKHGYCNRECSAFTTKNLDQAKQWLKDSVSIAEIDAALTKALQQKPNTEHPPLRYLAKIITGNREVVQPIKASKPQPNTRDFKSKEYQTDMAAEFNQPGVQS